MCLKLNLKKISRSRKEKADEEVGFKTPIDRNRSAVKRLFPFKVVVRLAGMNPRWLQFLFVCV